MLKQGSSSKLHDAELISVQISRLDKTIVLGFIQSNGNMVRLVFNDVVSFRLTDLVHQNVVSRLIVSTETPFDDTEISHWVQWVHSLDETQPVITGDAINSYIKKITNNELSLIVIEPSWGVEGAVICRSVHCAALDRREASA